jgi:hypothetical protein
MLHNSFRGWEVEAVWTGVQGVLRTIQEVLVAARHVPCCLLVSFFPLLQRTEGKFRESYE